MSAGVLLAFFAVLVLGALEDVNIGLLTGAYVIGLVLATGGLAGYLLQVGVPRDRQWLPLVVMIFPALWIYGASLGFALGNRSEYVLRNFAAMLLYPAAFALVVARTPISAVLRLLHLVGVLAALASVLLYFGTSGPVGAVAEFIGGAESAVDIGAARARILFGGQLAMFATFALALQRLRGATLPVWLMSVAEVALVVYVCVVCAASKGYLLALVATTAVMWWRLPNRDRSTVKQHQTAVAVRLIAAALVAPFVFQFVSQQVFNVQEAGNSIRVDQIRRLLEDATVLGQGLGATIAGYARDDELAYGFEISYLSLIHKLGIFAVALLAVLAALYARACQAWAGAPRDVRAPAAAAIGCMGYLFPALGNPILFSVHAVLLQAIALYLLFMVLEPASSSPGSPIEEPRRSGKGLA